MMNYGFDYDGLPARSTVTLRPPTITVTKPEPTPETAPGFAARCRAALEEPRPFGRPVLEQLRRHLAAFEPRRIPPPDRRRAIAAESRRILRELLGR